MPTAPRRWFLVILATFCLASSIFAQNANEPLTLEVGKPIEREMKGGDVHSYLVTLAAGQYMQAVVDQRGIDVVVSLYGPDGKKISEVDSPNGTNGPEPMSSLARTAGDYRFEVRSLEKNAAIGRYEVKVEAVRDATPKDRAEDLASALAAAKTEQERAALLEKNKDLQTNDLIDSLFRQGRRLNNAANDHERAIALYQLGLGIAERIGNKPMVAGMINNIGTIYETEGDFTRALEWFQKALALFKELGDKRGVMFMLYNVGAALGSMGDYDAALGYYLKYLALAEATGDKFNIAYVMAKLGEIYGIQGNYLKALEYHQRALTMAEDFRPSEHWTPTNPGKKGQMALALIDIGDIHRALNNLPLALDYHQKALALEEEVFNGKPGVTSRGPGSQRGAALFSITLDYLQEADYAKALEFSQKTLAVFEAMKDRAGVARALGNMARIHSAQGEYGEALEIFQRSLKMSEENGDRAEAAGFLLDMSITYYAQGDYKGALKTVERAAEIFRRLRLPKLWLLRTIAGKAYRALGQPVQARQSFEEAITLIENLRTQMGGGEQEQQRFFEDKVSPYQETVGLLISQNNAHEALAYAERAKARVLLDVLRSGRVNVKKALTSQEQEQERKLTGEFVSLNTQITRASQSPQPDQARLAGLQSRLEKARLDYEAFQINLYAAHPQLKTQRGEAQPIKLGEVADLLPDAKSAALEFVVTEDKTYLFVVTKDGYRNNAPDVKVYTLPVKEKDLADRSERFRQQIAKEDLDFQRTARELYDLLLKPAQDQLQGKTTLVIVPDDVLWNLPFQALQPTTNHYVIENQALFYAPSLTVLREMIKEPGRSPGKSSPSTLLAFGNPAVNKQTAERVQRVLMDEKLEPLPEAEKQVTALAQLYGSARSKVYTGGEAREDRAKAEAGNFRVLEFATHGVLNDSSPMYSHLVLSHTEGDNKEDGLLEAWEMMNLDLHADMVVLSACETARGRVGAGEGVIGMSWALFVAGSPTTVVSQWKVDSASTTELMLNFHRNLLAGAHNPKLQMTKAKALQQADLKLLRTKNYSHPFYWAGFVVVGDGF